MMQLSKDRVGAVFFLLLSVLYGYYGGEIRLYPGDEFEPMTARTLPFVLSVLGIGLSLFLFISCDRKNKIVLEDLQEQEWKSVALLIVLTILYGLALDWLGFLVSTILFLIGGFRVLGEKRWRVLLQIAVPFVFIFWFGLTQLLDIYLAPGRLFASLFSG